MRLLGVVAVAFTSAVAWGAEPVRLGTGDLLRGVPGSGSQGGGPLQVDELRAWLADPANHRELRPELPLGLDAGAYDLRGLAENPLTRAKVELGRQLFFDPRLSGDGTVSCASCHAPEHGYAQPTRVSLGIGGQQGRRNSPTAANRILSDAQFWDGRAASLEDQAIAPMASPIEMGFSHAAVVKALRRAPGYALEFEAVFGAEGITIENVGRAIAAFERCLVSGPSTWDLHDRLRVLRDAGAEEDPDLAEEYAELTEQAKRQPLSPAAERGAELFFGHRTGCTQCHAGANFTDEAFHNLGVGLAERSERADWGRYEVTGDESDRGAFKTPSLRNVAQAAPYFHDGSAGTLEEVVAFYARGGEPNPHLSPLIEPLDLTEDEQADLVEFLKALSGEWPEVEAGRLPEDAGER